MQASLRSQYQTQTQDYNRLAYTKINKQRINPSSRVGYPHTVGQIY